jgi:uncharacterized protein
MKNLIFTFFLLFPAFIHAQKEHEKKYEMKTYYLVFLKKGPNRSQDSVTVNKLQEQHMAHLNKMADEGKMDICGPLMDDIDIRGICVYNVATKEEAMKLASEDPMVKAGRLVVEIHPFYSAKGAALK